MKIKLIIFDLDGTLVDSSIDITNSLNYAIEPYDFQKLSVEKTISLVGEGLTKLVEKMLGEDRKEILPEVLKRFIDHYSAHLTDYTRAYPGVRETLKELSAYKKAVISNKREFLSKRLLEALGLAVYFDSILGSDSAGERKPSPKPLQKVMEILSFRPEETLMVGDSNFDIEAGKAAGVTTIAVTYGYKEISVLRDADYMIDDMRKLPAKLKEINSKV